MTKNTSPHPAAANIWSWSLHRWLMRAAPNGTCERVARSSSNSCHSPNLHLGLGRSGAQTLHAFSFNCVNGYLCVCERAQSKVAVRKQVVTNALGHGFRLKERVLEGQRNAKNENKAWGMTALRSRSELEDTLAELCFLRFLGGLFTLYFGDFHSFFKAQGRIVLSGKHSEIQIHTLQKWVKGAAWKPLYPLISCSNASGHSALESEGLNKTKINIPHLEKYANMTYRCNQIVL